MKAQQLTLTLTFDNPTPSVIRNLATLVDVADTHEVVGSNTKVVEEVKPPEQKTKQPEIRKRLNQLAGCAAIALKRERCEIWVIAYHKFFKLTGRHPVSESIKAGMDTHLDFIFSDPTWPEILRDLLAEMLQTQDGQLL